MNYVNEKYLNVDCFKTKYINNSPFLHIIFDNFIKEDLLENIFL